MGRVGVVLLALILLLGLASLIGVPIGALLRAVVRGLLSMRRKIADAARSVGGWTLIETLIVVAIFGIVLAIAIPFYNNAKCRDAIARGETLDGCERIVEAKQEKERRLREEQRAGEGIQCSAHGYNVAYDRDMRPRITCR